MKKKKETWYPILDIEWLPDAVDNVVQNRNDPLVNHRELFYQKGTLKQADVYAVKPKLSAPLASAWQMHSLEDKNQVLIPFSPRVGWKPMAPQLCVGKRCDLSSNPPPTTSVLNKKQELEIYICFF